MIMTMAMMRMIIGDDADEMILFALMMAMMDSMDSM